MPALNGAKKDYYTSATHYKDEDGNMKNFTFIDHDIKTSIGVLIEGEDNKRAREAWMTKYKEESIAEILVMPPISCPAHVIDTYIIRDVEQNKLRWNEELVRTNCMANSDVLYSLKMLTWKRTVSEPHWHEDMSHEDMMAGKWKIMLRPEFTYGKLN